MADKIMSEKKFQCMNGTCKLGGQIIKIYVWSDSIKKEKCKACACSLHEVTPGKTKEPFHIYVKGERHANGHF